jgi:hypothetical protein
MKLDGYSLLLPEGTLDYFDVINVVEDSTQIVIYLEEKNLIPEEYKDKDTESKGFYEPVVIRDFPIRGRQVFLNVRRRRWIVKPDGLYISRNWHMVASGTSMTREFASFLKEICR